MAVRECLQKNVRRNKINQNQNQIVHNHFQTDQYVQLNKTIKCKMVGNEYSVIFYKCHCCKIYLKTRTIMQKCLELKNVSLTLSLFLYVQSIRPTKSGYKPEMPHLFA